MIQRVVGAIRGRMRSLRGRSRSVSSVGFVAVSAIGLVVAMFLADGFRATSVDLRDAGVWATKADGLIGRINTQVGAQDAALHTSAAGVDVAQDGTQVFSVDPEASSLTKIDVAQAVLGEEPVDLPTGAAVEVASDTLLVSTGAAAWIGSTDTPSSVARGTRDPDLDLGEGGVAAVGRGGQVVAYSAAEGELVVVDGGEQERLPLSRKLDGDVQVGFAGDVPVALDVATSTLFVRDAEVSLAELGNDPQLQLSGDDDSQVIVATDQGLISVPTAGGEPTFVEELSNGSPSRPARIAGCSYAAWAGVPAEVIACDGHETIGADLTGVSGDTLRFRINRNRVVLNALESGVVFFEVDGRIERTELTNDDRQDKGEEEDDDEEESPDPRLAEKNEPPVANPDEGGARPGRPSVLTVLDNDVDANGDVLVITDVTASAPTGLEVSIVGQGQAIQVQPPAGATGSYRFSYTINDGREEPNSSSAVVTVRITPDDENAPPELKENAKASFRVESGKSATYDVLQDWRDPDGDPIFLEAATVDGSPDTVQTVPSGVLTFNDSGTGTGAKRVTVVVRDVPPVSGLEGEATEGAVNVQVEPARSQVPPVPHPDHVTTVVDSTVVIAPLENDEDANGDELHVAKLLADHPAVAAATISLSPVDDTITFTSSEPGSFVFGYEVTDGTESVPGIIRVDVAAPQENRPPSAGRDLIVLPVQASSVRTADILLNDVDPDGDVLVVQSVEVPPTAPITAQLLEHRRLRVAATGQLPSPVVIDYVVSDGQAQDTGHVVVVSTPASSQNRPPVLGPDAVTVRTGDVVDIPVLANDVDPEGDDLTVLSELAQPPGDGQGTAFVAGNRVRFVAPDRPMTVRMAYTVVDGGLNQPTGQITVTVRSDGDNSAPLARTVDARVLAGNTVRITVPLSGTDPDGDSVTLVGIGTSAPRLGRVVTPVGTDTITYEAFPADRGGTDSFSYRVVDQRGATAEGTVRVGVAPRARTNGAPQPMPDRIEVRPGAQVFVPVLANDYDPDGDPLSFGDPALDAVPEGLEATVDETSSKIRINAPNEARQLQPLIYRVTDGRGATSFGSVQVIVRDDAVGLPPVARDDEARPPEGSATTVTVALAVTDNDDDPDGRIEDLKVEVVGSPAGVSVTGGELRAELGPQPRLVVYRITDPQGLSARAVVRLPAAGDSIDRPPVQIPSTELEAVEGTPLLIDVSDHVEDPEGKRVRLTTGNRVSATHSDGSSLVENETRLRFSSEKEYAGPASITFEVTDGDAADTGNRVVVSLPIAVRSNRNSPPTFDGGVSLDVAPKEDAQRVDLAGLVSDPDGDDVTFRLGAPSDSLPDGVTVDLKGSTLSASAAADSPAGTSGEVTVVATDGTDSVEGVVTVRVVRSSRPLPTCTPAVIEKADAGKKVTRDVLADCYNPFPDEALELSEVSADARFGSASADGDAVAFTPSDDFVGTAAVRYRVTDAVGRTADGVVSVNVRAVPEAPSPPTVVEVSSRKVVLTWQPPSPNGASIEYYEVRSSHGTTRCQSTTCAIENLKNDTRYRFSVRAHNEVGDGAWSQDSAEARPDQRPDAPTNVVLTFDKARPDGQLTATWTASRNEGSKITDYEVQIIPAPDSGPATRRVGEVDSYNFTGLTNGTPYRVKVRAVNAAQTGPSDWSVESNPEVPATVPDAPVITSVQRVDDPLGELIQVTWSAPATNGDDISTYSVQAFREGASSATKTVELVGTEVTTTVDVDDVRNKYQFTVTATNKAGDSAPSPRSAPVQAEREPDRITSVAATDRAATGPTGLDRRALVSFTKPFDGGIALTRYEVRINGGTVRNFTADASGTPSLNVDGLTNGQSYAFEVRACNATACQRQWSPATAPVIPYGPVGTPNVSAGKPNPDQVSFNWSPPAANGRAVTGMQISINGGGWEGVGLSGGRTVGNGRNQTWSIRVRAIDAAGQIGPERSASATTDPPPPPPTVSARWGSATSVTGCTSNCYRMVATVSGFPANRSFAVQCQYRTSSTGGWRSDFGHTPPNLVTDANGNGGTGDGASNCVGSPSGAWEYRFVINGIASNALG